MSRPVAIVTGGGGGIGGACALALARDGHHLAILDRDAERLEASAERLRAAGARVEAIVGDAAEEGTVAAALERCREVLGPPEVAVGALAEERHGSALEMSAEDLRQSLELTTGAALALVQGAAREMIAAGRTGRIVLIGSLHATLAFPAAAPYNVAEGALAALARSFARDLLAHRIAVNVVEPGWVDTPGERRWYTDEQIAAAAAAQPWGRMARPEDIADAVAFLASPRADYITGATLRVDGGMSLAMTELPEGPR
jgi:glucose 1-dehydrogenase